METENNSNEKPIVVEGNYYWVKSFKKDKEFEPAVCRDRQAKVIFTSVLLMVV